ncbi:MAG: hypothetical protein LBM17_05810 [Candidatus Accumulibacter sp.]|jgi:hypothetical protein|nr:hypothetical protein [Accumulibacter sp.]
MARRLKTKLPDERENGEEAKNMQSARTVLRPLREENCARTSFPRQYSSVPTARDPSGVGDIVSVR